MTNHKENGYALLRVTFGVVFLFFGIGKFVAGIGNFAGGLNQNFSGKLPSALVLPFAYVLPFAEVVLGLLILLGLMTTLALEATGLLLMALTFGTVMLGEPSSVAHNVQYAFVNFILLWLVDLNRCSVDRLIKRRAAAEPSSVLVSVL
jgi:thiosulfate dehydrogenase [quinone] large subunit